MLHELVTCTGKTTFKFIHISHLTDTQTHLTTLSRPPIVVFSLYLSNSFYQKALSIKKAPITIKEAQDMTYNNVVYVFFSFFH